jgi:tRNA(Ile)-lysidine synthase
VKAQPVVAVAVSGGRDSMALLHCVAHAAKARGVRVIALHVNHGLQPTADDWQRFVERSCRARGIGVCSARLLGWPRRGDSVEAWARAGRYAALAQMARERGCKAVLLAHHRDDQAETFLLQALRGSGAAGLAAMPARAERLGVVWLRPWLGQSREAIDAYVRAHRIRHVDDQSNADPRFVRNRLRHEVMPALRRAFPDADASLAAAARRAAQERALIDEVALGDAVAIGDGEDLVIERWSALSAARRRAALRVWLAPRLASGAAETLLERLCAELPGHRPARWPAGTGLTLARYRGRLRLDRMLPAAVLRTRPTDEGGVPQALLVDAQWRPRSGAERFQRAADTPPRSLKKQFQAAGVPAWMRESPLLFAADGSLLFVPGLGTDARALARPGLPRVKLEWVSGT